VKFIIRPVYRFFGVLNNFCFITFSLKSMDGALGVLWALLFDHERQGEVSPGPSRSGLCAQKHVLPPPKQDWPTTFVL
jgi:hypothetical protein